jgi:hypothetical protein
LELKRVLSEKSDIIARPKVMRSEAKHSPYALPKVADPEVEMCFSD